MVAMRLNVLNQSGTGNWTARLIVKSGDGDVQLMVMIW